MNKKRGSRFPGLVGVLKRELAAILLHLVPFLDPFVFTEFGVEGALLQRAKLKRKLGPELLDADLLGTAEYVAVVAEEDVVALVVKCDAVAAFVLRIRREYCGKGAAHLKAEAGVEVVQNYFRLVFGESLDGSALFFVRIN